ncbi:hypothetical protein GCM10023162_21940 [Klenkia terrae]
MAKSIVFLRPLGLRLRGAVVLGLAVSVLPRRLRAGLVTRIRAVRAHRRLTHRPTEQESAP